MKHIRFRGKRADNGEWVYGHLFQTPIGEWKIKWGFREYLVKPDTIGQFTGLEDEGGKEIYEGDIVRIDGVDTPLVIVWDEYCACFSAVDYNEFNSFAHSDISWWNFPQHRRVTVIGNIHDNPELTNR